MEVLLISVITIGLWLKNSHHKENGRINAVKNSDFAAFTYFCTPITIGVSVNFAVFPF